MAENIAFPLEVRKTSRGEIKRRVEQVLLKVSLSGLGNRRPAQLSGGQQQRVALARALIFEPQLVLLDEPLGALDKQLRERMQYELKQLHEDLGVTMICVTHDRSEALTMSDRIAVFSAGRIQQLAGPEEPYESPENAFVAQFIGERNRLLGRVETLEAERCRVRLDDGSVVLARPVDVPSVGARPSLSLRPERVALDPPSDALRNVFEGRIEKLIYLGDATRVVLRTCGSDEFVAKIPNTQGRPGLSRGETVRRGWRAADCRAFHLP